MTSSKLVALSHKRPRFVSNRVLHRAEKTAKTTSIRGECGAHTHWGWVGPRDWTEIIHSTLNQVHSIKMLHKRSCKWYFHKQASQKQCLATEENAPFCSVIGGSTESSSRPRQVTTRDSPTTRATYRQSLSNSHPTVTNQSILHVRMRYHCHQRPPDVPSESAIMSNCARTRRTFCSEPSFNKLDANVANEGKWRLVRFPIVNPELPNSDGSGLSCGPLDDFESYEQCCKKSEGVRFEYRWRIR